MIQYLLMYAEPIYFKQLCKNIQVECKLFLQTLGVHTGNCNNNLTNEII